MTGLKHLGATSTSRGPLRKSPSWAQGAANILYRKEIAAADDPRPCVQVLADYEDTLVNPVAAGGLHRLVIMPSHTRARMHQGATNAQEANERVFRRRSTKHPAVARQHRFYG